MTAILGPYGNKTTSDRRRRFRRRAHPQDRSPLAGLLRQLVFRRLAGRSVVNDDDRLGGGNAMRRVAGDGAVAGSVCTSQPDGVRRNTAIMLSPLEELPKAEEVALPDRPIDHAACREFGGTHAVEPAISDVGQSPSLAPGRRQLRFEPRPADPVSYRGKGDGAGLIGFEDGWEGDK